MFSTPLGKTCGELVYDFSFMGSDRVFILSTGRKLFKFQVKLEA
jgi:hypothetical protein